MPQSRASFDSDSLADTLASGWKAWLVLVACCGFFGVILHKYQRGEKPTAKAPKRVAKTPTEVSTAPAIATQVYDSGIQPPDGFRVSVVGKRREFLGLPASLTLPANASYDTVEQAARACESIVQLAYEQEGAKNLPLATLRSSLGAVVEPRTGSVYLRLTCGTNSVEDYVDVPLTPNGRNRLWGMAVKLVDQARPVQLEPVLRETEKLPPPTVPLAESGGVEGATGAPDSGANSTG